MTDNDIPGVGREIVFRGTAMVREDGSVYVVWTEGAGRWDNDAGRCSEGLSCAIDIDAPPALLAGIRDRQRIKITLCADSADTLAGPATP